MSAPIINLLPWRHLSQARQQARFHRALKMALVLSVLLSVMIYAYHRHKLGHQQAINDEIRQRMTALDADIVRITVLQKQQQALLDKAGSINDLTANRVAMVRVFQRLATLSDGLVYFNRINHAGEMLTIAGVSRDSAAISRFAGQLGDETLTDGMVQDVLVTSLQQSTEGAWMDFVLTARLDLGRSILQTEEGSTDVVADESSVETSVPATLPALEGER